MHDLRGDGYGKGFGFGGRAGGHKETNVPGIFAAGDCTGGLLQIAKAVYQGAEAGLSAVKFLRERKQSAQK